MDGVLGFQRGSAKQPTPWVLFGLPSFLIRREEKLTSDLYKPTGAFLSADGPWHCGTHHGPLRRACRTCWNGGGQEMKNHGRRCRERGVLGTLPMSQEQASRRLPRGADCALRDQVMSHVMCT